MLVMTRKKNDSVVINNDMTITVVEIRGDRVRLGIQVPKEVPVHRQEVFDAIHGREFFVPPQVSPDEAGLLQAVLESPEEDGIRLMYADWLEERGDPRGEFIRLQCYLARLPAKDERRKALVDRQVALLVDHEVAWRQALPPPLRNEPFVRGFVETACATIEEFLDHAEQIFSLSPVRHLHVWCSLPDPGFTKFVTSPYLARLRRLDLSLGRATDGDVAMLADSPHLTDLRTLILKGNRIGDSGATRLAVSPRLATLTTLDLSHNQITVVGAEALAASSYLAKARLDLSNNQIGEQGVAVLRRRFGRERVES